MDTPKLVTDFNQAGQGHVFRFLDELDSGQRDELFEQAAQIDLDELQQLVDELVTGAEHSGPDFSGIEPAPYIALPRHGGDRDAWARARAAGEEALKAGRVAAFTVAGGQGTRLGFDGPKGTYPVTPVRKKTLFQVFAEKVEAASRVSGRPIPWFIMTSHINHAATVAFFEENDYFCLDRERVTFFRQGLMPAVDHRGKIILEQKGKIAMSPDGHGGSLRALVRSGAVAKMEKSGIDILSYFQIDNPLVRSIDPAFVGFHLLERSEMSSKMIPKAYPEEKLGHFCRRGGGMLVVEYSDMPVELANEKDSTGQLRFLAGSIAIHVLSRDFVKRVGSGSGVGAQLPFHRADKKIQTVDTDGSVIKPDKPNGIKFEMFVFDALPMASNPAVIETVREEDFSPVKNAEGLDSPETCRRDQLKQFARWFKAAGVELPVDSEACPTIAVEVSPLFADSEHKFVAAWNRLQSKPEIRDGLYLE